MSDFLNGAQGVLVLLLGSVLTLIAVGSFAGYLDAVAYLLLGGVLTFSTIGSVIRVGRLVCVGAPVTGVVSACGTDGDQGRWVVVVYQVGGRTYSHKFWFRREDVGKTVELLVDPSNPEVVGLHEIGSGCVYPILYLASGILLVVAVLTAVARVFAG
ncbi:MAG TPA: hypothetical protein VH092_09385 [Urbifossiella sp.]|jgi:hypothetical protein|nr:hypothetical protein [Urbifossiella sp.]